MDTPQIFTSALPEVPQVSLFANKQQAKHPVLCDKCNITVHSLYMCKWSAKVEQEELTQTKQKHEVSIWHSQQTNKFTDTWK